jgi:RNA-directed DNA polymerase
VLANSDWHVLDMYWGTRDAGLGERCRDADDMVMICRTTLQAQPAFHAVRVILQQRKRQLHPPKTGLMAMAQEGFDVLGVHCPELRAKHTGKLRPSIGPGQKAMKARRWESHGLTSRQR